MDGIFENWIDKSGRTLSLSNIIRNKTGEEAAWHALQDLGYAAVAWDERGVRVRLSAGHVDPGTVDGLIRTLSAVRRPITLNVWTGEHWQQHSYESGGAFATGVFEAIGLTD